MSRTASAAASKGMWVHQQRIVSNYIYTQVVSRSTPEGPGNEGLRPEDCEHQKLVLTRRPATNRLQGRSARMHQLADSGVQGRSRQL